FVELYSARMQKPVPALTPAQITALQKYSWPGNIRELEHLIQRTVLLTKGEKLADIPLGSTVVPKETTLSTGASIDEVEKAHIIETIRKCNGKVSGAGGAAERLGMNVSTLNSRMKKLGIKKIKNII
ncbi:MAG TPA: helix-turn-helix domain-containing protein, partial [Puia sp.]|nr:helix-turn-helix domain-containing protein [Puia sp.]